MPPRYCRGARGDKKEAMGKIKHRKLRQRVRRSRVCPNIWAPKREEKVRRPSRLERLTEQSVASPTPCHAKSLSTSMDFLSLNIIKESRISSLSAWLVSCRKAKRGVRKCRRQRMPESFRALFKIVSLTAAKTRRMFDVSVACVKLLGTLARCEHP